MLVAADHPEKQGKDNINAGMGQHGSNNDSNTESF